MESPVAALPHWDLARIYPALDSPEFERDLRQVRSRVDELEGFLAQKGIGRLTGPAPEPSAVAPVLEELITRLNEARLRLETMSAFVHGLVTTDSYNQEAARRLSEIEQIEVRIHQGMTRFTAYAGSLAGRLEEICALSRLIAEHRLVLQDAAERAAFLMPETMEDLAAELLLAGGGSMWKLQGKLTSQLRVPFERNGRTEELPITVIRNLAQDPSESVRRAAYEAELRAWESVREPIAFALNGVKGSALTLARRRGHRDVLEASLRQNRMDRDTFAALTGAIREALPMFRRYLASKARKLGRERLPWWDLLAPVGRVQGNYGWEEARDFIVEQFGTFSEELAMYARRAFDQRWIDAEPRAGKRGGAFCMGVPALEESRILVNFDGSFDQLITVAHELGHGFHNHCQSGLPLLRRGAPMTLAETASIFCETIAFEAALRSAPRDARIAILENQLVGATQVCVDISARILFESEVLRRRASSELSAEDLNEIMLAAQRETYGDPLDDRYLHPYMWVMKPHYYQAELNFYNYPYAFGQLFGLGIYALYRREGSGFVPRYTDLLRSTGAGKVADLAAGLGIDVRSRDFWAGSLDQIGRQVEAYCAEGA